MTLEPVHGVARLDRSQLAGDHLRLVTYRQAELDTKRLAAQFIAAYGYDELSRLHYVALPRGGLIVLGMLSYALNLSRATLLNAPTGAPTVVVDDCSLSGGRFGRFLQSVAGDQVIFAHLYSHPDLRAAVVAQEPRVVACLAAHDLRDLGPERHPDEAAYRAWQAQWRERLAGRRYWIGQPEPVLFPWSEPDRPFWNRDAGQVEEGWRLAAPDRCLKNWGGLGLPPRGDLRPTLRSPDDVAYRLHDDQVTLCNLSTDQVYGLAGAAADMWRALAAYGDLQAAAEYLLGRYEVAEARLRRDLAAFAEQLLARGLLERADG